MTYPHRFAVLGALTALALFGGCSSTSVAPSAQATTKYTIENNTDQFAVLDQPIADAVSCTGFHYRTLPDGRFEVVANVRNAENRPLHLQVNCVFTDADGFEIGDETPFRTLVLTPNSTEAVRFTATNKIAKRYRINVRLAQAD
jgi:uncharacterized protein YcfL